MEAYTYKNLKDIFRIDDKAVRQTIFNAEERHEIPRAVRIQRGKTAVRQWTAEQLPEIGARFGFLKAAPKQEIISFYTQKGGTLKTTLAYTLARTLALNGIKTVMVGLDSQGSVTKVLAPVPEVSSIEELKEQMKKRGGLYHLLEQPGVRLEDVVERTDLPTLDVIPETGHLVKLEKSIDQAERREHYFSRKLIPLLKDYQVIIFDNNPGWSHLAKAALACATTVISPVGCDAGTLEVLDNNIDCVLSYKKNAVLEWRNFLLLPTLLEPNKLSQDIYKGYIRDFTDNVIPNPIRRAIAGQEAQVMKKSVIEYSPNSQLASDYYTVICALWNRICDTQRAEFQTIETRV